ncbi:hypothetical protein CH295_11780 [Rhodococcus sp. 14-2483-1-2]|nr:hypothetical protein CH295_11780 [Rhodococcus sp. 14-2483-1-2]
MLDGVAKLRDVALRAGVGVGTASRAMSGRGYVDPATRQRIVDAADELGYRPNKVARALRENRTGVVGLLLPDMANEFYTESASVIQAVLAEAGLQLVVATSGPDTDTEDRGIKSLLDHRVDGIVQVPVDADRLMPAGIPIVQLNRRSNLLQCDAVVSDDETGIRELTEAATALGHRDIAFVTGDPEHSTSRDRLRGFMSAARDAGLQVDGESGGRVRVLDGEFSSKWGRQALHSLRDDLPTMVVAASSRIALGVLHGCADLEIDIPTELSVAAHGDPEWYQVFPPAIACYAPPLAEMGRVAATLLLDRMQTDAVLQGPEITRLRGEVHLRKSLASTPGR